MRARGRGSGYMWSACFWKTCLILKHIITHLEGTSCARMPAEGAQMGAGQAHAGGMNHGGDHVPSAGSWPCDIYMMIHRRFPIVHMKFVPCFTVYYVHSSSVHLSPKTFQTYIIHYIFVYIKINTWPYDTRSRISTYNNTSSNFDRREDCEVSEGLDRLF